MSDIDCFYLSGTRGKLFSILHSPLQCRDARGALLFLHPFAEEMNKSRRMVALQARAMAECGWFVLQVDLYGCGDSAGELEGADWSSWLEDLEGCAGWLAERTACPIGLWALRSGALLALELAERMTPPAYRIVLWQPVLRGSAALTALLRQRLVAELGASGTASGTRELRERLARGETLELSGYPISPALAQALEGASLAHYRRADSPIDWIDVVRNETSAGAAAPAKLRAAWESSGIRVSHRSVVGEPFWSSAEIVECPELIAATCSTLQS